MIKSAKENLIKDENNQEMMSTQEDNSYFDQTHLAPKYQTPVASSKVTNSVGSKLEELLK
jgi:hypothetical protein